MRLRATGFGFFLIFTLKIGKRSWPRGKTLWRQSFILGLFGTVIPMMGIISALMYLSSGLVSILISVAPAFTIIMAHFFLDDENINTRKGGGILFALSGAVLLIILGESGLPEVGPVNPLGYLMVLGGMFSGSTATIYARKFMRDYDTFDVTGIRLFVGAVIVFPISLLVDGFDLSRVTYQGLFALLFTAIIGTFFGMILSLYNIQNFGATAAVMTTYVIPVVSSVVGVIFLKEKISIGMVAGVIIILLGVWLIRGNEDKKLPITQV